MNRGCFFIHATLTDHEYGLPHQAVLEFTHRFHCKIYTTTRSSNFVAVFEAVL